jgi:hypothetical protein
MATAISDRRVLVSALAARLVFAGCGGAVEQKSRGTFTGLRPTAVPAGWSVATLPSRTADMAYPPGWRRIQTDPGTVSAALLGPHGRIRGYLNATPWSGGETLANWARFRPAHNHEEGDRQVVPDASSTGVRFRSGTGSCVVDHYATVSALRYREIACIVRGPRGTTVVVGAALEADWARLAPALRQSVASFST